MPTSGLGMCCRMNSLGEDARRSVLWFLLMGGRHVDTAQEYNNHAEIGEAVRQAVQRGVPRSEIFVTTKLLPGGYNRTMHWFPLELQSLGLEYVDLVLVHIPGNDALPLLFGCGNAKSCRDGTWHALSEFRRQGLTRNIGVSNFGPRQMREIMSLGGAPIAVNQLEYHPWVSWSHVEAVNFCHQHGIAVTAYCSLGGPETKSVLLRRERLQKIGAAHGKTAGQILLRWATQKNASVIPGTGNPKHMRENLDIYDFNLSEADMAKMESLEGHALIRDTYTGIPDQQD